VPRVDYGDEFARDLENDVRYLQRIQEPGWIATLEQDLSELEALLGEFPLAGVERARTGSQLMLKMRMRRAPFHVWYIYDPAAGVDGVVTFIRLFHTRQQTPELRLG